jgi:hAT family C-terminal dimerisation region
MPQFKTIFTQAQEIVQGFSYSPKQLGILRQYMKNSLGGIKSFALSVITRWGSQVRMLQSLQRVKLALKIYYTLLPTDAGQSIRKHQSLINNQNWWDNITNLLKILNPIDEAIKMSESDKANLHYVVSRWKKLWKHLDQHKTISAEAFEKRFKRQTNDCHLMAYLLNPATVGDNMNEIPGYQDINWHERAYAFFVHHQIEPVSALKELDEFREKTGRFYSKLWCWQLAEDASVFWNSATILAPTIGPIAIRLMSTPATSVPSERAFSILNLVHNKLRNRLSTERVDKLQYIYINERVLRKIKTSYEVQIDAEAEAEVEAEADVDIEDLLVELEDNLIGAQDQ